MTSILLIEILIKIEMYLMTQYMVNLGEHLKRMCILLLWVEDSINVNSICSSMVLSTSITLIFCLVVYQLLREVLKCPTIIVDLSISPCSSISFCFMYFEALLLQA